MEDKEIQMPEESIESKIRGHQAQIDQMNRMIEENRRQIELGDDVQGREKMIITLTNFIKNEQAEINKLSENL